MILNNEDDPIILLIFTIINIDLYFVIDDLKMNYYNHFLDLLGEQMIYIKDFFKLLNYNSNIIQKQTIKVILEIFICSELTIYALS